MSVRECGTCAARFASCEPDVCPECWEPCIAPRSYLPRLPAQEVRPWQGFYTARLQKVVDGDTLDLLVDVGLATHTSDRFRLVRAGMKDYDAPEVFRGSPEERERGKAATARAKELLGPGEDLRIRCEVDRRARQVLGKYRRWIAAVYFEPRVASTIHELDGRGTWLSLADCLTVEGHTKDGA